MNGNATLETRRSIGLCLVNNVTENEKAYYQDVSNHFDDFYTIFVYYAVIGYTSTRTIRAQRPLHTLVDMDFCYILC